MTAFSGQSWSNREGALGDEAEGIFESVARELGRNPVRSGLCRPPFQVSKLPKKERYRPDYMDAKGFIEVQGFGRDQTVKLKVEKYAALSTWNIEHEVSLFLWNNTKKQYCLTPLTTVERLVNEGCATFGYFPEPKAYFAIKADQFGVWVPLTVAAA